MTHERKVIRRCLALNGLMKYRHSRRSMPTGRSQYAFAFGACTGVRRTLSPKKPLSSSASVGFYRRLGVGPMAMYSELSKVEYANRATSVADSQRASIRLPTRGGIVALTPEVFS